MAVKSAGILAYHMSGAILEVFLAHPGGPFFARKDKGVWSVPKGEYNDGEDPLTAAKREFEEEIGVSISGAFMPLAPVQQKNHKTVYAWAVETQRDLRFIKSNTFPMEWPPHSGKIQQIHEVDKAEWFALAEAKEKIMPRQVPLLEELEKYVKSLSA
jgi:predicted NUDIX family NTP pyrophosphohydrolase